MAKVGRILIAGGGIAGLTTAIALRHHGFEPEIVERSVTWQVMGAGIALQPNAMRVLHELGVGSAIEQEGTPLRRFVFRTSNGEVLAAADLPRLWGNAGPLFGIARTRLQAVLRRAVEGVPCRLGIWVESLEQMDCYVLVMFSDGSTGTYDLVIGADGIGSAMRSMAIGRLTPRYIGQMVWRSLAPLRAGSPGDIQFWLGEGAIFGLIPVAEGCLYGFGNIAQAHCHDPERGRLERLRAHFARFGEEVQTYLAAVSGDEEVHCGAIGSVELECWHHGRVVLIGDAAHASSPMMGQGGCMAIEDAFVLAELLAASDRVEAALDAYARRRWPRVKWVQEQSRSMGESLGLPPAKRDAALREHGERMLQARFAPLLAPP